MRSAGFLFFLLAFLYHPGCYSQSARVIEEQRDLLTYSFSDPNPVANTGRIYPYFRFDGYTNKGKSKIWKVIKVENPYIEVLMAPEIGGKILGAFEKSTNNSFIYFNNVVKFRDIAQRGAWTSGGIEYNFGSIGHTPASATPVDYIIKTNKDGSISCFFGGIDLSSRTEWRVEVVVPKDKAYFETIASWYNPTGQNTSLYHWMNASTDVGKDMKYNYPGINYIDHGGKNYPWTINNKGVDISYYGNNNFGEDKSYHVLGKYTDFLGVYWKNKKFGSGHLSLYPEKAGKKIWMWSQARKGAIWVDLLTDPDKGNIQYTEIQTGILFNQSAVNSTLTPFKHLYFAPYSYERFPEKWFPFKNTGGITEANDYGVLNVEFIANNMKISFCALQEINEELFVKSVNKEILRTTLNLKPMETYSRELSMNGLDKPEIIIGNKLFYYSTSDQENKKLDRPQTSNQNFDWNSLYGIYTTASENAKQRNYIDALTGFLSCLKKDPAYSPALVGAGRMYYRKMDYDKAKSYYLKALANDTYDPDANFFYAELCRQLGNYYNAMDAYGIAGRSMKYRSASYLGLAEVCYILGRDSDARYYSMSSLEYNSNQLNALKVLSLLAADKKDNIEAIKYLDIIIEKDPLNHYANFEKFFISESPENLKYAKSMIRNELPAETYIELAIYYYNLGKINRAFSVFENSPPHPVVYYWLSYLSNKNGNADADKYYNMAIKASPELIFPFREETARVLEWAKNKGPSWKTSYYLALINWNRNNISEAGKLFTSCGNKPDYPAFYLCRGKFIESQSMLVAINNYKKAVELDKNIWRGYHYLTDSYIKTNQYSEALLNASKASNLFSKSFIINFDYARTLLFNNKYQDCIKILDNINILPNEGARSGHDIYRQAHLLQAIENIKNNKISRANKLIERARLWPENLGVGRPYDVDERPEDILEAICARESGKNEKFNSILKEITSHESDYYKAFNSNLIINVLAWRLLNRSDKSLEILLKWKQARPEDIIQKWAKLVFEGNKEEANKILQKRKTQTSGTPWNPAGNDPTFKFVYEMVNELHL